MRRRLLAILTVFLFTINTCYGAMVTVIEKNISYSFTKTPGNRVTLEAKDPNIQGWQVNKGNVVLDENDSFIMIDEDIEVEALYVAPTEFSLIVDKFGVVTSEYKTVGEEITVTVEENSNYTFLGWQVSGVTLTAEELLNTTVTFTMPSNSVRLVTLYESNNHTLTVNPGGYTYTGLEGETLGIVAPGQTGYTVTYNHNYTGGPTTTATANKIFNNWTLTGGGSINNESSSTVTYTFGSTDGELTASYGTQSITLPNVTRAGYNFLGWNTDNLATTALYNGGSSYTPTNNITLYAVWELNSCTVSFDPNGGTGTMNPQTFTYGVAQNLTLNTFTKEGHTFVGWAEIQGGAVKYADGASYTASGDKTLYAVWEAGAYTLTYDSNGGTGSMSSQGFTHGQTKTLLPNIFTKEGHTFSGWSTEANGVKVYDDGASYTATGNATLYAVWTANTYTVTYDANGGAGTMTPQAFTYGVPQNLTLNTFTKEDYTFDGWSTTANGAVEYTDGASYTATGDVTLYAVWKGEYVITAITHQGGVIEGIYTTNVCSVCGEPDHECYLINVFIEAEDAVVRERFEIPEGVTYGDINGDGNITAADVSALTAYIKGNIPEINLTNADVNIDGNVDYYDVQIIQVYNSGNISTLPYLDKMILFNENIGESSTFNYQLFTLGEIKALTPNTFTRDGYTFSGWSTTPTGSVQYADGANYLLMSNVTLYAVWEAAEGTSAIEMVWDTTGQLEKSIQISTNGATTINWGDGVIENVASGDQTLTHTYTTEGNFTVKIADNVVTSFNCASNKVVSLDIIENTSLQMLRCNNNNLSSLDISKNTALTYLNCASNNLSSLDLSKNIALVNLYCHINNLNSLDLSKNTSLKYLNCYTNNISNLDVSNNTALIDLRCSSNNLSNLDVSKNLSLTTLSCSQSTMNILVMDSTQTVVPDRHANTYIVRMTQSENGEIGYTGGLSFGITPDTGYEVLTLTVGGNSETPATTYTFSSLTADTTITATFGEPV